MDQQLFSLNHRKSHNALHLELAGDFDGPAAYEVATLLQSGFSRGDRVFFSTARLRRVHAAGRSAFRALLRWIEIPPESLYFKGGQAAILAPEGSRVIRVKKCRCGKDCATCDRRKQEEQAAEGNS